MMGISRMIKRQVKGHLNKEMVTSMLVRYGIHNSRDMENLNLSMGTCIWGTLEII